MPKLKPFLYEVFGIILWNNQGQDIKCYSAEPKAETSYNVNIIKTALPHNLHSLEQSQLHFADQCCPCTVQWPF